MELYPHNNSILNRGKTTARNRWVQILQNHPTVDLDQYKYLPVCKICKRKNNEEVNNIRENGKTGIFQDIRPICLRSQSVLWVKTWCRYDWNDLLKTAVQVWIGYDKHLILGWESKVRAAASTNVALAQVPPLTAYVGLSLLLVLSLAPRGFFPGTRVYPFSQKPTFPRYSNTPLPIIQDYLPGKAFIILLKQ